MRVFCILTALFLTTALYVNTAYGAPIREYATVDEVLQLAFPGLDITRKKIAIPPEKRARIEELTKGKFSRKKMTFHIARKAGEVAGYAAVENERGKKRNITFMVSIDPQGKVMRVDILTFRESQGYEIENPKWREQFKGKSIKDPLRVKRDIVNISGATMSSRAVTRGVKKVLAVVEVMGEELHK
jgi:Na+-translocating ferredoxin:NAD+ oxidoreductase RnfG subunit